MEERKTKVISLWVDFALSLLECMAVVIFTLFAKSPIGDLNQLVNIVFDFILQNNVKLCISLPPATTIHKRKNKLTI